MRIIRDVERMDHVKRGSFIMGRSGCFIFKIVTTKLIEPRIDEIPKIFSPNIHISGSRPRCSQDRIRRVGIPGRVCKAKPYQGGAYWYHPECDCIQLWPCHVFVSYHDWYQVIAYARSKWYYPQEQHCCAMNGENSVECISIFKQLCSG